MASETCRQLFANMMRRKANPMHAQNQMLESQLHQKLGTFELTLLGIGSMVGAGLYVLTGVVAKETAGPAIVVSYLISAVVAILIAMCYAELAAKIPRTGSAYTFIYIALGEVWAFFIGWNLLLEYVVASASVGRGISGYIDHLCNGTISNFTIEYLMGGEPWQATYFAQYPDLLAIAIELFISIFVILGVSISSWMNTIFLSINVVVVLIICGFGIAFGKLENWTTNGGFAPFGIEGVVTGAATLFYSFVGFDTIANCNEEAINPKRGIPISTIVSVSAAAIMYIATSASLTLLVPYSDIDVTSSFPNAMADHGITWATYAISVGAISAMSSTLLGAIISMCRCVYAIANDGLLFPFLARINERTKTPINATLVSLILTLLMTICFSMDQLVRFLSVGTLNAFAFASGSLIILRYQPTESDLHTTELTDYASTSDESRNGSQDSSDNIPDVDEDLHQQNDDKQSLTNGPTDQTSHLYRNVPMIPGTLKERYRNIPIIKHLSRFPPGRCVVFSLLISVICVICALAVAEYGFKSLLDGDWWAILLLVFFTAGAVLSFLLIAMHHQETPSEEYFSVKFVPLVPYMSILADIFLLLRLDVEAWVRYVIWLAVGAIIYFAYGYRHSHLADQRRQGEVLRSQFDYGTMISHQD
ncbi:cationic amino acid transporter 4-like [Lytechinus variegatus]|uniref:cationic amino acid transporter 4-like n=1 Tax=Lytechinus variegatus TaxID=7654 RepID=UPI001BB16B49|nr:cationic amino acid transporter 4-like [Lytechinus variegatus]